MTTEYEAIKAGAKEAVTEWLQTPSGRDAIEAGVKSAVLDWFELSATGQAQIPWATERAVTAWLDGNKGALAHAIAGPGRTGQ
ncbi:hypothetical protein [Streptomyces sp. NPDC051636]|uniref:hypothetical protein n=1 Tax=Streptomyces sp. NPDC051636 TaxID=3365663 RepID=UPI003788B91E